MNIEKIFFETQDNAELVGLLHTKNPSKKVIISVHGMTSDCLKRRDDIIAKTMVENGIDYFTFNNRGHDVIAYIAKDVNGEYEKQKAGTAYENIQDSYYDINAAIDEMMKKGYEEIYLQGHSLGCTKIVYTYNRLKNKNESKYLEKIKVIMLLSLVDIPKAQKINLGDKYNYILEYAQEKEREGKQEELMPSESFIHPLSVKTYLKYFGEEGKEIDFAKYSEKDYDFKELNNIQIPLFMRWGDTFEMIEQKAQDLVQIVKQKLKNPKTDINYIEGANHGYTGKEQILADQILNFLLK